MKTLNLLFLITPFLISCSAAVDTPSQVAEKYWQAVHQGDTETAKTYISSTSAALLDKQLKAFQAQKIDAISTDKENTTVTTVINPHSTEPGKKKSFNTTMVFENEQWKIDLNNTQLPTSKTAGGNLQELSEKLSDTIKQNVDTLEEVMGEGMNLLSETLRESSEEMGGSLLDAMKELNEKMHDSIDKLKQRKQEKAPSPDKTEPESGEDPI